jgi:uncharacterized membrane protein YsdA (DUF1294 family)
MGDILIKCSDCGRRFTWSVGEQHYYRQRGLNRPKRCKACRERQRREREASGQRQAGGLTAAPKPPDSASSRSLRPQLQSWWTNPTYRFGLLSLGLILLLGGLATLWLTGASLLGLIIAWLIAVNIITLLIYRYDKLIAGQPRLRVPEIVLLGLALAGGSPAAFVAMYGFKRRHKTQSPHFLIAYWSITALQVVSIIFYFGF